MCLREVADKLRRRSMFDDDNVKELAAGCIETRTVKSPRGRCRVEWTLYASQLLDGTWSGYHADVVVDIDDHGSRTVENIELPDYNDKEHNKVINELLSGNTQTAIEFLKTVQESTGLEFHATQ